MDGDKPRYMSPTIAKKVKKTEEPKYEYHKDIRNYAKLSGTKDMPKWKPTAYKVKKAESPSRNAGK